MSSLITRISSNLQLKDDYISSIIRRSNYYYKDYYRNLLDGVLPENQVKSKGAEVVRSS